MTPKSVAATTRHHRLYPDTRRLLRYAVASRLLVLTLIIIWRSLLSPYDTSASINPHASPRPIPQILRHQFSCRAWDRQLKAALCGMECTSRALQIFGPLVPVIGYRAVLGLSGYVLNNIAFVFAALYLYRYSESLYAFFSFGGLYHFMNGTYFCATFWLALSGCARSNGVLNAGYICFRSMQQVNEAFVSENALIFFLLETLCSICIFIPFISFQAYGYFNICVGRSVVEMRPWCKARLPLLYNYIQSHYWGVGFLKYFQVKQLPNFLLASPILSLAICSIIYYVKLWPEVFLSLGLRASSTEDKLAGSALSTKAEVQLSSAGPSENDTPNVLQGVARLTRANLTCAPHALPRGPCAAFCA
ncbi:hypothetical protein DH2020_043166 [Rehmannia glutinosa]|uniref:GPI mannosyltransferase 2 n=1 Tax=Rehmannia glutinosa TaxID=99300 RepID=A0ABR0UMA0_REHGL